MSAGTSVEALLRWRLARAAAAAPPPPSAATLLAGLRPWWETEPARWAAAVARVSAMQLAYGRAMTTPDPRGGGHPVPALVVADADDATGVETRVRVLYLSVRDGRLRLRFLVPPDTAPADADLETLVLGDPDGADRPPAAAPPLLVARADRAGAGEYRLDTELPEPLARRWGSLKVTDRMPFRLVLRPLRDGPAEAR